MACTFQSSIPGLRGKVVHLVFISFLAVVGATAGEERAVHLYIFLSKDCPHCGLIEKPALKKLERRAGCRIDAHYFAKLALAFFFAALGSGLLLLA